jgi:hypothetical protein
MVSGMNPEELSRLVVELANGTVTVEVARRQPDSTWRWVLDQPNVFT